MILTSRKSISIIFPAYNEAENIEAVVQQAIHCIDRIFQEWEIILVNDGSQDRTGELINRLAAAHPSVMALHHDCNEGYGAALKTGITHASKDLLFFCDADLQFHLSELLLLLIWSEQYDLVIGYREKRCDPWYRRLNAMGWNFVVRCVLRLHVRDIDCAFKLFHRTVFEAIRIDAVGAMVNTDILVQATRMGFAIREVPITHFPRHRGQQTGARLRVICKAFRELASLYRKLRSIEPIVFTHDRRGEQGMVPVLEKRRQERRQVTLPINFPNRRRRYIRLHGALVPLSPEATAAPVSSHE